MARSLGEYAASYEWHVLGYALILAAFFVKFLLTMFTRTPVSVLYSILICLFLLASIIGAVYSVFVNSDRPKFVYAYSLIPQLLIVIAFVVLLVIHIKPIQIEPDQLDRVQPSLECCGLNPDNEQPAKTPETSENRPASLKSVAKKGKKEKLPESCCPKLDEDGDCTSELAYKEYCDDRYSDKVYRYKARAIVLMVVTGLLQCLIFFSFYRRFLV